MTHYTLTVRIKPVVEFVRHDAEIYVSLDDATPPFVMQRVIKAGYATNKEAEEQAEAFCANLYQDIANLVRSKLQHLKTSRP